MFCDFSGKWQLVFGVSCRTRKFTIEIQRRTSSNVSFSMDSKPTKEKEAKEQEEKGDEAAAVVGLVEEMELEVVEEKKPTGATEKKEKEKEPFLGSPERPPRGEPVCMKLRRLMPRPRINLELSMSMVETTLDGPFLFEDPFPTPSPPPRRRSARHSLTPELLECLDEDKEEALKKDNDTPEKKSKPKEEQEINEEERRRNRRLVRNQRIQPNTFPRRRRVGRPRRVVQWEREMMQHVNQYRAQLAALDLPLNSETLSRALNNDILMHEFEEQAVAEENDGPWQQLMAVTLSDENFAPGADDAMPPGPRNPNQSTFDSEKHI